MRLCEKEDVSTMNGLILLALRAQSSRCGPAQMNRSRTRHRKEATRAPIVQAMLPW